LARLRRNICEPFALPRRRAFRQIEPKAKLFEEAQLEAYDLDRKVCAASGLEAGFRFAEKPWMRIALRKNLKQGGNGVNAHKSKPVVKRARRRRLGKLYRINTKLIVEPGTPLYFEPIPRLQNRTDAPGPAALYEAVRAAIASGEDIGDDASLAMRPAV
jgi:hypothetical protein